MKKTYTHTQRDLRAELVTAIVAQTILDCFTYTPDKQMARCVARDAGMFPLTKKDHAVLKRMMGPERLADFKRACDFI